VSYLGDLLFVRRDRVDLDAVLRHRAEAKVRELVDGLSESAFANQTDEQLAQEVYKYAQLMPLRVDFDKATAAVKEVPFETNSVFGERLRVKGLRATKTIPFTGDADLWHLLTNPHDMNPPHGAVSGQTVVIGIDVREQEGDQANSYISDTVARIKTYVERQAAQIETYNKALPARIKPIIQQRRSRLSSATDLLKKLQQ
jgi:hypothetical protein